MQRMYVKVDQYKNLLRDSRWIDKQKIHDITICPCGYKKGNTPPPAGDFVPFDDECMWTSAADTHAWFHFKVDAASGVEPRFLYIGTDNNVTNLHANPQFILYINGEMRQGLDTNHRETPIGNEEADIYLYAYTTNAIDRCHLIIDTRRLLVDVDALYYDLYYPFESLIALPTEGVEYARTLEALYHAVSMLDLYEIGSEAFHASVNDAREYLRREYYEKYAEVGRTDASVIGIGHTHIDCAWLWTFAQTREKVQRSFSTVLELMDQYPEYKFTMSQPLLYKFLKEEAPEVYEKVRARVKEGRWECEGAMWVEADCNLTSGESLVRQVMYGKNFFKKEFGVESRVLWLPDVFGYSAALPQILRKSGVDWFVTSKISWNDTNRMPYDTFSWRGIDGSEVNTYFITAQSTDRGASRPYCTYVGKTNSPMTMGAYKRYNPKYLNDEVIVTYGYGDGGGGPTAEHLELARRATTGIPGVPPMKLGLVDSFLDRLEKKIDGNPLLPGWFGELYLEYHRGTYTTQARNKLHNRRAEFLYENAEALSVLANRLCGQPIPVEDFHYGWENILSNQFHDVIPGSSIRPVYEQCERDYAKIFEIGENAVRDAENAITSAIDKKHGYVVFNQNSFVGEGEVKLDGKTVLVSGIAPKGYSATNDFVSENHVRVDGKVVETDRYKVEFNDAWQISSIYDKDNDREVIRQGEAGNEFRLYVDYPDKYDAWEWKEYSREQYRVVSEFTSAEVVDDGARRGIRIVRPIGKSTVTQTVWFTDASPKIDFETEVDWHEKHKMFKAAFPVDVISDKASFEIQFGTVERPTHFNTSWDRARFEVCAQKYADLSDGGYGVSIINDCKYGHDIHDGVICLSLLRSPTYPDPIADEGLQVFTYAICPHAGTLADSNTARLAYALNAPMKVLPATGSADKIPTSLSMLSIDKENVLCETIKPAEDGEGFVARLYEYKNRRVKATVTLGLPVKKAILCDLLENPISEIPVKDGKFSVPFGGFEIVTVKLI